MHVDLGNSLSQVADPGISRDEIDRLDTRVTQAHERIQTGRTNEEFGYAALNLPDTTNPAAITESVDFFTEYETVLTIGIGGSALGAATLTTALGGSGHVLDNIDPAHTTTLLDTLELDDTVVHVVSRSGETIETLANFLVVRDAITDHGLDWTNRTIVTTGQNGTLRNIAEKHELPTLDFPQSVPGRFSVLSPTGLVPAAITGHDIEAILNGARQEANQLTSSLFDCPAYAYGAITHALENLGITVNVMMPYAERLETFAEWFAQLWAESLGKDGRGQTPVRTLGATDQHSQLQLYRAGRRNTMITFVRPVSRVDHTIPESSDDIHPELHNRGLGELLDIELDATEASLAEAGRPNVRIEIEELDEHGIGRLLYAMQAACILNGELGGVNAFDQPAVDWSKQAIQELLRGTDTGMVQQIKNKHTFLID